MSSQEWAVSSSPGLYPKSNLSTPAVKPARDTALDALRGLVMVIMALDHVRDFFHANAMRFSPEDLSKASAALFLTRWITHFCAPTFMFVAGVGAALRLSRGGTVSELSRYLWTRGLWLLLLEITVFRFAITFGLFSGPLMLVVLWALGMAMIALSALVWLPQKWVAVASVLLICLHNLADPITASSVGSFGWLWHIVHEPGVAATSPITVFVLYPVVPWIAVMAAGYCFGPVLLRPPAERQKILIRLGTALTLAFLLLRTVNIYGDPQPRLTSGGPLLMVLSFLRATKYPPSLDFLLMTLGPSLLMLALFYRLRPSERNPLTVIGRVPLFYFLVHFLLAHTLAFPFALAKYGNALFLLSAPPSAGGQTPYPPDFGYSLPVVYLVWLLVLAIMYPLCVWYGRSRSPLRRWI